jgi:hypothetical protein
MNALVMDYTLLGQPGEHFFNARVALADAAPVPEPGTLLLMGTGALVLMRRRQLSSRYR